MVQAWVGFVCPATTIAADMWKWGHVRPGDKVRFEMSTLPDAFALRQKQDARIGAITAAAAAGDTVSASQVRSAA